MDGMKCTGNDNLFLFLLKILSKFSDEPNELQQQYQFPVNENCKLINMSTYFKQKALPKYFIHEADLMFLSFKKQ